VLNSGNIYEIGNVSLFQNSTLLDLLQINMEAVEIIEKYSLEVKQYETLNNQEEKSVQQKCFSVSIQLAHIYHSRIKAIRKIMFTMFYVKQQVILFSVIQIL